ncbi:hypothetical protein [Flavobacterium aestivum]|uniref:hypothetical protein n=1 Tax=Flavobacterium aestivum TaxID=3003257 RepID=UPI002286299C|nr:hypothetical protein [Flavobacterium aestivum]
MKIVYIILATFLIAFVTSAFFELDFFSKNPVRYFLLVLLIVIELAVGFFYIKSEIKQPGGM